MAGIKLLPTISQYSLIMNSLRTYFSVVVSIVILSTLSAATAVAHPGHGQPGPLHQVTEPVHAAPIVVAAVCVGLAIAALTGANLRNGLPRSR